jgi:periplasmic protein CpxP/Spy
MKKLIAAGAILMMISSSTFAQHTKGRQNLNAEEKARHQTERISKELELTESQKNKIMAINLDFEKRKEAEMDARKKEQQKHQTEIQAVLTEDQKAKWAELKDERKAHEKGRPGGAIHQREEFKKRSRSDN